jgi:GTPase SAR1 family protein
MVTKHIIYVQGEAAVGKSTLIQELIGLELHRTVFWKTGKYLSAKRKSIPWYLTDEALRAWTELSTVLTLIDTRHLRTLKALDFFRDKGADIHAIHLVARPTTLSRRRAKRKVEARRTPSESPSTDLIALSDFMKLVPSRIISTDRSLETVVAEAIKFICEMAPGMCVR